jgi:hypothetical protein
METISQRKGQSMTLTNITILELFRYCSILFIIFTTIRQPMLKLETHSGFRDLFRFTYSNMTSFFRFVRQRAIYRWYNLIRTCAGE